MNNILRFLLPDILSKSQKDVFLSTLKIACSKELKNNTALFSNFLNCKSRQLTTMGLLTSPNMHSANVPSCPCYVCIVFIMVIRWWIILFPKPWSLEKHYYQTNILHHPKSKYSDDDWSCFHNHELYKSIITSVIYYIIPKYAPILHSVKTYTEVEHSTFTKPITPIQLTGCKVLMKHKK